MCLPESTNGCQANPSNLEEKHFVAVSHQDQQYEDVLASNHQKQNIVKPSELPKKDETYKL
jgi:hypothetical protein|tara:strand:- start:990 stop:1172 length:183 start_codon:yes stop_codon:yes gene_type:complete